MKGERGESAISYVAVSLLLAGVVAAVVSVAGLDDQVLRSVSCSVAKIASEKCDVPDAPPVSGGPRAGSTPPPLDADGYWDLLCRQQQFHCDDWDPSRGLSCNDHNVVTVYRYYADLYLRNPELQWAGMASLAGGLVYGGMQDLHVLRKMSRDAREEVLRQRFPMMPNELIAAIAGATEAELEFFEDKFVAMHKQIFRDLGWQHLAYDRGGIQEIRRLADEGQIPRATLEAWEDIASGDPRRVSRGNEALLYREQKTILQDDYDEMKNHHGLLGLAVTYMMGQTSESPIPGGRPFRDVVNELATVDLPDQICLTPWGPCQSIPVDDITLRAPIATGNIATFDSRWKWISEDMLPRYQELLRTDPDRIRREVRRQPGDRAAEGRLIPIGYDPKDGVC
ncbi:DUF2515 family protein [Actinomadura viridis]|uniref:DUF2515 family protein n=1 Tax=Actinomadura viridis TaxID=58110 RepID=UPI00367F5B5E